MARGKKGTHDGFGKWERFTEVPIGGLHEAVSELLRGYGDVIYQATEDGVDAGAYALLAELKQATPKGKTKLFSKKWKVLGTGGKYKLKRYLGNETVVTDKQGNRISLANIFEYSTTRGNQFISRTVESSTEKVAAAIVAAIKKEA